VARLSTVGNITPATGAPQRPDAAADGNGHRRGTSSTTAGNGDIVVAPGTSLYGGGQTLNLAGRGWNGGGQLGYNWQLTPAWVLGFETDIQGSDISGATGCLMAC
jgi:outer membrane immunogenic protein